MEVAVNDSDAGTDVGGVVHPEMLLSSMQVEDAFEENTSGSGSCVVSSSNLFSPRDSGLLEARDACRL